MAPLPNHPDLRVFSILAGVAAREGRTVEARVLALLAARGGRSDEALRVVKAAGASWGAPLYITAFSMAEAAPEQVTLPVIVEAHVLALGAERTRMGTRPRLSRADALLAVRGRRAEVGRPLSLLAPLGGRAEEARALALLAPLGVGVEEALRIATSAVPGGRTQVARALALLAARSGEGALLGLARPAWCPEEVTRFKIDPAFQGRYHFFSVSSMVAAASEQVNSASGLCLRAPRVSYERAGNARAEAVGASKFLGFTPCTGPFGLGSRHWPNGDLIMGNVALRCSQSTICSIPQGMTNPGVHRYSTWCALRQALDKPLGFSTWLDLRQALAKPLGSDISIIARNFIPHGAGSVVGAVVCAGGEGLALSVMAHHYKALLARLAAAKTKNKRSEIQIAEKNRRIQAMKKELRQAKLNKTSA